jgi:hypothetical protein
MQVGYCFIHIEDEINPKKLMIKPNHEHFPSFEIHLWRTLQWLGREKCLVPDERKMSSQYYLADTRNSVATNIAWLKFYSAP